MKHDINNTAIVPYIIAEQAIWDIVEADDHYKQIEPYQVIEIINQVGPVLIKKAETIYKNSEHFRKLMNDRRKDARMTLGMFMEHWAEPLVKTWVRGIFVLQSGIQ